MRPLRLYEDYTREEVHDIFSPDTPFIPQRGTWGLHGIVKTPDRRGDFVFFITFGQQQGDHVFDEGVTEDGVLSWQSQPRQGLDSPQIRQLITHDELENTVHLFLRTRRDIGYTYLGQLKYLSHDAERENPVYFQWQILDWNPPQEVTDRIGLLLQPKSNEVDQIVQTGENILQEVTPPSPRHRLGVPTTPFRTRKLRDFSIDDVRNRELGLAGERLVLQHEKKSLVAEGQTELATKVLHVSEIEGDGAGYDIKSFTAAGEVKYIEVKTTCGPEESPFFMTSNEVKFSETHEKQYYLYRLYNYDKATNSASYYVITGYIRDSFTLTPKEYRVTLSQS